MKRQANYTNPRLTQFNCYKHRFTNYRALADQVYMGYYTERQGVALLQQIYLQFAQCDVPEDYQPIVALAFRMSVNKYRRFCREEQRLTQYQTVL